MPTTGMMNRSPDTDRATHPAVTMISLPSYVPTIVAAAKPGSASAIAIRIRRGLPAAGRLGTDVAGISGAAVGEAWGLWLQHFLDERRDVVALPVQHRAREANAGTLERPARALHVGDACRIGFDDDDGRVEMGPDDESVAVHVDRREIDDDEVELLAQLREGRRKTGRVEEAGGGDRGVTARDGKQIRRPMWPAPPRRPSPLPG